MNGFVVFIIILLILIPLAYGGWVFYSRTQARKLGLPPPSLNPFVRNSSSQSSNYPGPAPVGIKGWINAQIYKFKNRNNRYAAGSYEPSAGGGYNGGGAARGGAGSRLDPDEAWDARVGNEAYYEEQELGLHEPSSRHNPHAANPFETAPERERGRSRTREEYDEYGGGGQHQALQNPFGDDNAASLRGVSPRPLDHGVDTSYGGAAAAQSQQQPPAVVQQKKPKKPGSADGESLTDHNSRRSLFREDI
ncbi:hypothetical protein DM02DRAFT_529708 [Periconia macrospinosa]|uniref:Acid phosphatase-like protein n=1 Tax=Periconia macrospinosa TaxID=97972 RepID=A0A2V1DLY4_9PLEO|nr:hypothetical protein DM02DRAFT_529708 [Periconia macrospinosa]